MSSSTPPTRPRALTLRVLGVPVPQAGTKSVPTARGRRSITEGGKGLASWRQDVSDLARAAAGRQPGYPLSGPLWLSVAFRLPMPVSRPKKARTARWAWSTVKPDLDKLTRAIGDSLKVAGVIGDDAQIAVTRVSKMETLEWTGAHIQVGTLEALTGDCDLDCHNETCTYPGDNWRCPIGQP